MRQHPGDDGKDTVPVGYFCVCLVVCSLFGSVIGSVIDGLGSFVIYFASNKKGDPALAAMRVSMHVHATPRTTAHVRQRGTTRVGGDRVASSAGRCEGAHDTPHQVWREM